MRVGESEERHAWVPPTRVSRSCIRDTPPPVLWEKRLQVVENKGQELKKEGPFEAQGKKEAPGD
jgi:hypothetical protein